MIVDTHTHMVSDAYLDLLRAEGGPKYTFRTLPGGGEVIDKDGVPFFTLLPPMWDFDRRIKDMDAAGVEQALEGHTGGIFCLAQGGAYLFSGGDDLGVKTWQYAEERFAPLTELKGHTAAIQVMKTVPGSLITADRGGTVAKWCLETGAAQMTFNTNHTNQRVTSCEHHA